MNFKQVWEDLCAIGRGIKKAFDVTINVGEALAWAGVLGTCYTVLYLYYKGEIALSDTQHLVVFLSTGAITLRVLVEGAKYFKQIGSVEVK